MYLFYVDESGTESLNPEYIKDPNNRLYVLTAIGVYEHRWQTLESDLNEYKLNLFPKADVSELELHMNILKQSKSRAKHQYFSKLSENETTDLINQYLNRMCNGNFVVFAIIIDKLHFKGQPQQVVDKAHELLIERIENYLREFHDKHNGIIIYDEKNKQNMKALSVLQQQFIQRKRTSAISIRHLIEIPFFVKSEFSNGIQLADLCAYSVNKAFCKNNFNYPEFIKILPSIYKSTKSFKKKYDGIKVFPDPSPLTRWEDDDPHNKK